MEEGRVGGIINFLKLKSILLVFLQAILFFLLLFYLLGGPFSKNSLSLLSVVSPVSVSAQETKSVSGWLPSWDQERAFESLRENEDLFDELSPFWYDLSPQGELLLQYGAEDKAILEYTQQKKIKVLPTISNEFNGEIVNNILNNPSLKKTHINNIINKVLDFSYEGIDIDYENLFPSDRESFSLFIQELATALHSKNKLLVVTVHPKTSEPGSWSGNQAQDWEALGKYADKVRIMGYDYHWDSSEPGPIAPVSWLEEVITFATTVIPKNKIILGIPFYGYDWVGTKGESLVYVEAINIAQQYGVPIQWDKEAPAPWFQYPKGGVKHEVWFENYLSLAPKLDLVLKYDLGGIAFWRLGGEDKENWNVIRKKLSPASTSKSSFDYVSEEVFVKFKEGVTSERIKTINQEIGVQVIFELFLQNGTLQLVKLPSDFGLSVSQVASEYATYPEVEYAEVNRHLATLKTKDKGKNKENRERGKGLRTPQTSGKISKKETFKNQKRFKKSKAGFEVRSKRQARSPFWQNFLPLL